MDIDNGDTTCHSPVHLKMDQVINVCDCSSALPFFPSLPFPSLPFPSLCMRPVLLSLGSAALGEAMLIHALGAQADPCCATLSAGGPCTSPL